MSQSESSCLTAGFKLVEAPVKSENDHKQYRSLVLDNGLRVLLVSDLKPGEEVRSEVEEDAEEEDEEEEKMAAAALAVGCGSFSDPDQLPGLAHFVEHMVFMGSEPYPQENAFDLFITSSGGTNNAYTDCESTVFHFDVNTAHMAEALNRFAHFFISPLMRAGSMTRERQAVENEFGDALPRDENRREQLFCSLARDNHPMHKFMWGNLVSLSGREDGGMSPLNDTEIHREVHEFWRRYYRAQHMVLAVQARQPLDTLQEWVLGVFGKIPSDTTPRPQFGECGLPWSSHQFSRLYRVVSVKDQHKLIINWQLPSLLKEYRCHPLGYISFLLGHEGVGSVFSLLKRRHWAVYLESGNGESGFEHNSTCSTFHVQIGLTDAGLLHVSEVAGAVWAYIAMLQRIGAQKRIFEEIERVDRMAFRFMEESTAEDWVQKLVDNMLQYTPSEYISGAYLTPDFNKPLIDSCIQSLMPDNCNVMISSKTFEQGGVCSEKEFWFGTQYSSEPMPSEWLHQDFSAFEQHFSLPEPNPFIADDFSVLSAPSPTSPHPTRILHESGGELYHRQDTKFLLPRAFACILLRSNLPTESAVNAAMFDLFHRLLNHALAESVYPATTARLGHSLKVLQSGYSVCVHGFSDKLSDLLRLLIEYIVEFEQRAVDSEVFEVMKREQRRHYANTSLESLELNRDLRMKVVRERYFTQLERLSALEGATEADLIEFARRFRRELFVQMLVQGNVSCQQAEQIYRQVQQQLDCHALAADTLRDLRMVQLPCRDHHARVASRNADSTKSTVVSMFQSGPGSIASSCLTELLLFIMEEPTFDFLRTRHQLGYHVFSSFECLYGVLDFIVLVNFHIDKYSAEHVSRQIDAFLDHFDQHLEQMTEEEFIVQRDSLITKKQCADVSLEEEVDRNWYEVITRQYVFDRLQREVGVLSDVTLGQVHALFRQLVGKAAIDDQSEAVGVRRRKLCVEVVGFPTRDASAPGVPLAMTSPDDSSKNGGLSLLGSVEQKDSAEFISSIDQFKSQCTILPVSKVVK